jgi:hypothetical protein
MKKLLFTLVGLGIVFLTAGCSTDSIERFLDAQTDSRRAQTERTRLEAALMEQEKRLELRERQAEAALMEQEAKRKEEQLRVEIALYEQQMRQRIEIGRVASYTVLGIIALILSVGIICTGACIYSHFHTKNEMKLQEIQEAINQERRRIQEANNRGWHQLALMLRYLDKVQAEHLLEPGGNGHGEIVTAVLETEGG